LTLKAQSILNDIPESSCDTYLVILMSTTLDIKVSD